MKKLVFILMSFPFCINAQFDTKVDSLNNELISAKNNGKWRSEIGIYYSLGKLYFDENEHGNAFPYYLVVDSLAKAHDFVSDTVILSTLDRSEISRQTFTYQGVEDAHRLQKNALEMAEKIESKELIYEIYLRLADMNGLIGDYNKMKDYLDLVYPYYMKLDNPKYLTRVFMVYMNYYYYIKDFDKGGEKLKEGIEYLKTKDDSLRLARLIAMYGTFFRKRKGDCNKAIEQLEKAEEIYKNIKYELTDTYMYLMEDIALCSKEIGDYEKASIYFERAYKLKKELVNKANSNLTRKLETRYQSKVKQHEIELLQSQNELAIQQKRNQRNLYLGGLGLTTMAGLFFFFLFKNRQKTNKKLKELGEAKSHFFANISHEFRTPLTLIQSPIDEELEKENLENSQREKFNLIKRNSQRLLNLVDQLLMLSKIEVNAVKLKVTEMDLNTPVRAILASFSYGFQKKGINFKTDANIPKKVYIDYDVFDKIVTNLISNSLKYTPEKGLVKLYLSTENKTLIFRISNSGNFLNTGDLKNIFDRFYQIDSGQQGYGIGLTLVKELTEIHKGEIKAFFDNDMLVFEVRIPVSKDSYIFEEIEPQRSLEFGTRELSHEVVEAKTDDVQSEITLTSQPQLLIVEDNNDMRDFIKSIFSGSFKIIEARNGIDGIKKATEQIPDIIISDLMMPKLNGLELTKRLKTDFKTSHIPIIILTAKADDQDKLKGLEIGVDDYIAKPFKNKILQAKVKSLIDNRSKLREYYNHEVVLKPAIFSYNKTEEKFFLKLQHIINEKLQDPNFNADSFSKYLGMNRMQLHRKLTSMLGVSASEFLRNERLKASCELLKDQNLTIAEVAYMSGFNDPNYFSKCFKDLFNITPTEYTDKSNK